MSDRRQAFQASIIACARWEHPYIVEWLQFHFALGFEHIYLYCNDDDPAAFKAALGTLSADDRTRLTYRAYAGQGQQQAMYLDALRLAKYESRWLCFLDIDEFMVLKHHMSVPALIETLERQGIVSLQLNWVFYGNNAHETRPGGLVLSNYTKRAKKPDVHTKHLSRSSCFEPDRISAAILPIWHGLTNPGWIGFNRRDVLGEDAGSLLSAFPATMEAYLADDGRCEQILATAYIAHFVFKSSQDFLLRVARGLGGNFGGQIKWLRAHETGETASILEGMNAVEDRYLAELSLARAG